MATIKITDLHPVGRELFQDPESFLSELTDGEIGQVKGGDSLELSPFLINLFTGFSPVSQSGVSGGTLQTVNSNNMLGLRNGFDANTINGQSINGLSYSNANTIQ